MTMKGDCVDYYIMCLPCVMPSSMAAHAHNTGLIQKQNIIEIWNTAICHEGGGRTDTGVGLDQIQYIVKGMTYEMGLHLVYILNQSHDLLLIKTHLVTVLLEWISLMNILHSLYLLYHYTCYPHILGEFVPWNIKTLS